MAHTPRKPHVLVVEDDDVLRRSLVTTLEQEGYEVRAEADGTRFDVVVERFRPELVVLDVRLPAGPDGYTLARRLRQTSDIPVIFLSAADAAEDRLRGFDAGGDDYLVKPFFVGELLARLTVLLRRAGRFRPAVLRVGDLIVDEGAGTATRAGVTLDLTPIEFALLSLLLRHRGQVLSKTQLLEWLWDDSHDPNLVEAQMSALRRKLETHGPRVIHTIRTMGYRLSP